MEFIENWNTNYIIAPPGSDSEDDDEDPNFADRSLRESIRAREQVLSSRVPGRSKDLTETSFDVTSNSIISNESTSVNALPRKLTAHARPALSSKTTNDDDADDFSDLQDMLGQWSAPQMESYLGEVVNEVKSYYATKRQQEDEEINKLETKLSNLWSERQGRLQKHMQAIKEKEEAERRRIEEEERQRKQREEEERQRKIREEEERARLAKEKAEAEAKRKAEEEAEKKRKEEEAARVAAEKAAADKAAAAEKEAKEKQEEAARKEEEKRNNAATAFTNWPEVNADFQEHKKTIADIKTNILAPVTSTKELKSFCFQAKRKIKPKLGQLTDSQAQLEKMYNEIVAVITECQSFNELAYMWILNFFSKSLVAQAETETIVSIQSALPLGRLGAMLMVRFKELSKLLLARFVKKCPFVIGFSCPIDTEEGRLRMGWKRSGDKWEDPSTYAERVSGICAVWTVMSISQINTNNEPHPYPISNSWKFLARMANTKTDVLDNSHFSLVATWWDIASDAFVKAYGKQGVKLLQAISGPWTQQVLEKRYPSALRLGLLGEDWQSSSSLKSLKPMEY